MCFNYKLDYRNTTSHLLQVYLGAWAKIKKLSTKFMSVKLLVIVIIVFKRYPGTHCLKMDFRSNVFLDIHLYFIGTKYL